MGVGCQNSGSSAARSLKGQIHFRAAALLSQTRGCFLSLSNRPGQDSPAPIPPPHLTHTFIITSHVRAHTHTPARLHIHTLLCNPLPSHFSYQHLSHPLLPSRHIPLTVAPCFTPPPPPSLPLLHEATQHLSQHLVTSPFTPCQPSTRPAPPSPIYPFRPSQYPPSHPLQGSTLCLPLIITLQVEVTGIPQ